MCVFIKQKQALQTENVQSRDLLFTYIYVNIYLFAVAHVVFLKNIKLLKIEVLESFLEQWYCFPLCCKLCLTTILDNVFERKKMVTFPFPSFIMLKLPANILNCTMGATSFLTWLVGTELRSSSLHGKLRVVRKVLSRLVAWE